MPISQNTVQYVADLTRIQLEPKELEHLSQQLQDILGFIDTLNKLDVEKIKPTSHILPLSNVLREDIANASLDPSKALQNAPLKDGNFFIVPKIIE